MTTPTYNRLSTVEAQRVIAILDETLEKLTFLGSITPDVLQHRDELSQIVGDEISRIIHEQRDLEAKYEELIAKRSALKVFSLFTFRLLKKDEEINKKARLLYRV